MDDLSRSTFFDSKLLILLQKIIWGQKASAISSSDKYFISKAAVIQKLNEDTPGGLIPLLRKAQDYVSLPEALLFLIKTEELNRGEEGIDALENVWKEEKRVTKEMLDEIFRLGEDMPFGWAVPLVGDNGPARHEISVQPKSSLDLNRLRDFK